MKPFTYERATSPAGAAAAAARHPGSRFVAGGTNLLDLMKLEIETPPHLIDVNGLKLDTIETTADGGLRIGALVRNTDLAAHERVRRDYGVLSRALAAGASGQLRNMATTAGNLLENAGKLDKGKFNTAMLLGGPEIQHYHQAIAVVVAETFAQARAAGNLLRVEYAAVKGSYDLEAVKEKAPMAKSGGPAGEPASKAGNFATAFAEAPVQLDATYTTSNESHSMMEPHATLASWEGDQLTLWTSNQMIAWGVADMAMTLGIPKEKVRLISPYIGGGFGGKLFLRSDALMAAPGARAAKRPVKVTLTRAQMPNNTTDRAATIQRIRIAAAKDGKGIVTVETDMTDIGTGSYTIIAQTAAEMMGVALDKVVVRLGDSSFPVSCGSGGQWGGNNSTAGVYAACMKLRGMVTEKAGFTGADLAFTDGEVRSGQQSLTLAKAAGKEGLLAEDFIEYGDLDKKFQQSTFGAHFVEVAVDAFTGETRVRRMLAVCAAGRILNPKTARSQVIGAMTMAVGSALMEELAVDKRHGFFVNHDLAGYEVPTHADIPHQEVIFLDETDPISSPMKAKGVGEPGICGAAAAVANAIYNATGVRVRDYPVKLEKLIDGLPELDS